MLIPEGLLDWIEVVVARKTLDRRQGRAVGCYRKHKARLDDLAITLDRTGPAITCHAANVSSG
jgi:hypothetical protein